MSRTRTCALCLGDGTRMGIPCPDCGGNGYINIDVTAAEMTAALEADGAAEEPTLFPEEAPAKDIYADVAKSITDLTNDKPAPGRMANQTWRILEEQRMAAKETIRECEAEIERWTDKMVDAHKTLRMAEAGQAVLDGAA